MFEFLQDLDNYELRKISKDSVAGLEVSTVYTSDEGYETAIIDANAVYPVERYPSKELAIKGHEKWLKIASDYKLLSVKMIGTMGFPDEEVKLTRNNA